MKDITIVIPSFNRGSKLDLILPTYLNQSNISKTIIVDDASNDNTEEVAKKYKNVIFYRNERRMGTSYTKNLALSLAKTKYVFIGEDDVSLHEDFLKILLSHMKLGDYDIVCGRRIWAHKNTNKDEALKYANKVTGNVVDMKLQLTNFSLRLKQDVEVPLLDACMLIKTEVIKNVNFDYKLFSDPVAWRSESDFQLSALEKGYKLGFCPHVWSYHLPKESPKILDLLILLKYDFFVLLNNYKFVRKHKDFIEREYQVPINLLYHLKFISSRFRKRYFLPLLKILSY